jgi:hypothetical protein
VTIEAHLEQTTATPETESPSGLAESVILRINPLPGRRLGIPELTEAVRVLVEAERRGHELAEAACAELFDLAAEATGRRRQRILDLKRAIYNNRPPGSAAEFEPWPAATTAWLDCRQRSSLARSVLTTGYESCLAQERAALAETVGTESFQLSLALTSPLVLEAVRRYANSGGNPSKRDRKSERGILQHVTRAMVRTSPLTRFTAVGFGSWSAAGSPLDQVGFQRRKAHSLASTDRVLISGLVGALRPDGDPATVGQSSMLRIGSTSVQFHHVDGPQVRVLSAPLTTELRTLLDLTAMGELRTDVLSRALAQRLPISVPDAERLVAGAVQAQILVPGVPLDEQAEDPLPAAIELLRPDQPEAAAELAEMARELGRFPSTTVPERVALLNRLDSLQDRLTKLGSRPVQLHVNEDYVLEPIVVSPAGYEQALADLADVTQFGSLFDRHQVLRALACVLFVDRFGPGAAVPLIDHASDLVRGVLAREATLTSSTAADFGPADGSLLELLTQRARAVQVVSDRLATHTGEELVLDPGLMADLADGLPERFERSPASYGLLVQPVDGRFILNDCYPGHGLLGVRFLGADRDLGGRAAAVTARRATAQFGAGGASPREDRGLHGVNINHRIPLLERTITAEDWLGIRLAHDPDRDELVLLDADGTRVSPISLGMRWLELLPAPLRLAMYLTETSRIMIDSFGWEQFPGPDSAATASPRLLVGQVVLQRRRWYPGPDFPAVPGPEGAAQHLVDVTAWRAAHGVPEEIMIKSDLGYGSLSRRDRNRTYLLNRRREKPQYVDLASALAVRILPRLLDRRAPGSYLEEALPGVRAGRPASEWIIEFDRPAGGRFKVRSS